MSIFGINLSDPEAITGIVLLITTLGGSISTAVSSMNKKLNSNAVKLIGRAEEKYEYGENSGATKHDYVVNKLYMSIPVVLRPLFSKERLGGLVNNTFKNVYYFSELRAGYNADGSMINDGIQEKAAAMNIPNTNHYSVPHIEHNPDTTEMRGAKLEEPDATIIPVDNQIKHEGGDKNYGTSTYEAKTFDAEACGTEAYNAETRGAEAYNTKTCGAKTYLAHQQMPCDGILQDAGVQNSVRVHTLWSGHDFVCRTEYRVRKRKRNGGGHRPRQAAWQCRNCSL